MSSERNLSINNNDNDNQQLDAENEYSSTITNVEYLISLPQVSTGEITIDPHDMTNQQINTLVVYPRNYFDEIISYFLWIFNFSHGYINQFLHLLKLLTIFITHLFVTYKTQYDTESHETLPEYSELPYPYNICVYRDAEADGRTAHPTDESVIFSSTTMSVELTGAEYINAYEDNIRVNLNDVPDIEPILNNGNDNLIPPNIQNDSIGYDINNEDLVFQNDIDNRTCNINPVRLVQSQHIISSNDSSDDECTSSCQSGFDSDDECETSDGDLHTGAVLLVNNDANINVQDNSLTNESNLVHEQATATVTSSNEAAESRDITTITESDVYFDRIPVFHLPKTVVPIPSNDIHSSDELEEESII